LGWSQNLQSISLDSAALADTVADSTAFAPTGDTIQWESEYFHYDTERKRFSIIDSSSATLKYQGAILTADTIHVEHEKKWVEAWPNPTIEERSGKISGLRLKYNHEKQVGHIYYASTRDNNQLFKGTEVRRQKTGEILISRGCFSSCGNAEDHNYYFYSRRMVLEPKKQALAKPVVFNVEGVPIAVLPMAIMPLGKGRRSGFLRPKIGGDQVKGFFMRDLGYYWATNDYMDVLVKGDVVEGEAGTFSDINWGGTYNYKYQNVLSGSLSGKAFIKEFNPDNSQWEVNFKHDQNLTPDQKHKITGSGRFVSASSVLDEALTQEDAVQQNANAQLGYSASLWENRGALNVTARQENSLTTGKLTRNLPTVDFSYRDNLIRKKDDDYWVTPDLEDEKWYHKITYQYRSKFDLLHNRPEDTDSLGDTTTLAGAQNTLSLSGTYPLLTYINITPSIEGQHYWSSHSFLDNDTNKRGERVPKLDWNPGQGRFGDNLYKLSTSISANTKLYGIAQPNWGPLEKVRHTITPTLGFTYRPHIENRLSFVTSPISVATEQEKALQVNMSLRNDVDIKWLSNILSTKTGGSASTTNGSNNSESKKIFSTNSSVNYDFEKEGRKWSDISSNFSSEIVKYVPLNINMTHRLYDDYAPESERDNVVFPILTSWDFSWRKDFSIGGDWNSGLLNRSDLQNSDFSKSPWRLNMDYGVNVNSTRVSRTQFATSLNHTLNANARINPTPKWEMSYNTSYNFNEGKFSTHQLNFNRTLHCWNMSFRWTPVGISRGWSFTIYITDIPDIKIDQASTRIR
jgi:hypothetical protein